MSDGKNHEYTLPNGVRLPSMSPLPTLEFIPAWVEAPKSRAATRMIEVHPDNTGSDFEVLGFLSCNLRREIAIRSLMMGGKEWEPVDPHLFYFSDHFPFYPLKVDGIVISADSPLYIEFAQHEASLLEMGYPPPVLRLWVVGRRKRTETGLLSWK